jgi:hypothetical protein
LTKITRYFLKYLTTSSLLVLVFTQFIACGAESYQISLENDVSHDNDLVERSPDDPLFGIHAPEGWAQLPINFKTAEDLTGEQVSAIRRAMRTWEWALGRTYGSVFVYDGRHEGIDASSFEKLYSSLQDRINGMYFEFQRTIPDKKPEVIATTIWDKSGAAKSRIETADIRYNSKTYILGDAYKLSATPEREVVDLESLALHEVGHLLGLQHIPKQADVLSIMNPTVFIGAGMVSRTLSKGDILRIQKIYGCEGIACDIEELLASTFDYRAPDEELSDAPNE